MARKAEFVFVGDADSLVRAARKAQSATGKLASSTAKDHKRIGSSFAGMAKRAIGAGTAMVGAYASIAGAKSAISTTEELAKTTLSLHKGLGLSVEQASRWAAVAKSRAIDGKQLNQSFGTLSKNVVAGGVAFDAHRSKLAALGNSQADQKKRLELVAKGAGAQTEAFKKLGITQAQLKSPDFDATLKRVADGLGRMPAGANKAALSMKLFGKGWQTVVPLLRGGSKAMDEQLALADKYGVTFKGKTVKSLQDLIAAQRESKFATMGLQVAFGTQLAPAMTKVIQGTAGFVNGLRQGTGEGGKFRGAIAAVVNPIAGLVRGFKEGKTGAVVLGGALISLGSAFVALKTISALTTALGAAKAGMVSLRIATIAENGALIANPIGLVVAALVALGVGLVIAYKKSEKFRKIVDGAFNAVKTVASNVFPIIGKLAKNGLLGPIPFIIARWGAIKKLPGQVLGFFKRLPGGMVDIAKSMASKMRGAVGAFFRIGLDIVKGLANGIKSKISDAVNSVKDLVTSLPKKAMGLLGINSPSKVFAEIGHGIGEGLRDGLVASKTMVAGALDKGLLFPVDAAITALNARKEKLQASMEAWDARRQRQELVDAVGAAGRGEASGGSSGAPRASSKATVTRGKGAVLPWLISEAKQYGLKVTSTTGGKHAKNSYHYKRQAIDAAGSPAAMARFFDAMKKQFGGKLKEMFYDPRGGLKNGRSTGAIGGHGDHVHIAATSPLSSSPRARASAASMPRRAARGGPAGKVFDFFRGQGFTDAQAAAWVGNLTQESGLRSNSKQRGGPGRGLAQWGGGRFTALQKFASSKGKGWTDFDTQLKFIMRELSGSESKANRSIKGAKGLRPAVDAIGSKYERYGIKGNRYGPAESALKRFGGGKGGGTGGVTGGSGGDSGGNRGLLTFPWVE